MELTRKLAIITGASRGIGRALSLKLAKSGCGLLLTALENEELNDLTKELQTFTENVRTISVDLVDSKSRDLFLYWIKNNEQPPDILINNAGIGGQFGKFENENLNSTQKTIALNVYSFIHLTHELIPLLRKRPRAKIVNISSGIAKLPYPGLAVYGATKAFISSFSESLACELAGSNIDVLCFYPGFTSTHFMESSEMDMRKIPRKLIRTPEFVASRIVKAIRKDYPLYYSDFVTAISPVIGSLIPQRLKLAIFKKLFWELPDGK